MYSDFSQDLECLIFEVSTLSQYCDPISLLLLTRWRWWNMINLWKAWLTFCFDNGHYSFDAKKSEASKGCLKFLANKQEKWEKCSCLYRRRYVRASFPISISFAISSRLLLEMNHQIATSEVERLIKRVLIQLSFFQSSICSKVGKQDFCSACQMTDLRCTLAKKEIEMLRMELNAGLVNHLEWLNHSATFIQKVCRVHWNLSRPKENFGALSLLPMYDDVWHPASMPLCKAEGLWRRKVGSTFRTFHNWICQK